MSDTDDVRLSANFSRREFLCPCCGRAEISPRLVETLQGIRDAVRRPIRLSSAWRCVTHNQAVGGAEGSEHLGGTAADIVCETPEDRYQLVMAAMAAGVRRIKLYPHHVHIGVRVVGQQCRLSAEPTEDRWPSG